MICPKCKFSNNEPKAKFCPKCGFEYATFKRIMLDKFTDKKKRTYNIFMGISYVLSVLGIVFYIVAKDKYFFGVFALASLCLMNVLTAKVGVIDRLNIPPQIQGYVKFMTTSSMIINLTNLTVLILFIVTVLSR